MFRTLAISSVAAATAAFCLLSSPAEALAQESTCASDADCPQGLVCEVMGASTCPGMPACPEGEACPEPPPCETQEWSECIPGPCASDADCGEGLVCISQTHLSCADVAMPPCEPGVECPPPPEPPPCEEYTESFCGPKWAAPCAVDADCGDGFRCVEEESCWCEGSAGVPACEPGVECPPVEPVEPVCGCDPTGRMMCELIETSCTTDADCPTDFTCVSHDMGTCSASSDGSEPVCETIPGESVCEPAMWGPSIGIPGGVDYNEGGASTPTAPAPTPGEDGTTQATPSPRGTSDDSTDSEGGCSVGGGTPASTPAWLLLGLVGLLARRRRTH